MPFNGALLVSTANRSAEVWQWVACVPERISSDEMVDLVICFPLRQLGRWALYIWTYLCVSPYPDRHHYTAAAAYNYSDDDSDDDYYSESDDGAASSSRNNHHYHYCSYCNQNSAAAAAAGYDSSSNSD